MVSSNEKSVSSVMAKRALITSDIVWNSYVGYSAVVLSFGERILHVALAHDEDAYKELTFVRYRKVIYEKIIQIKGSNEP